MLKYSLLREFACEVTSSWPPARVEGSVWAARLGQDPANLANPLCVPECVFWTNAPILLADFYESDAPVQCDPQSALRVTPDHPNATQGDPK